MRSSPAHSTGDFFSPDCPSLERQAHRGRECYLGQAFDLGRRLAWAVAAQHREKVKKELTTRERFDRMFKHREADRVPILGGPWGSTIERWNREGMPEGVDFADYFGVDRIIGIGGDVSPRYPERIVEETDDYVIRFDSWGTTAKNWKHASSTPHWISRTVVDRPSWEATKARIRIGPDRVDWDRLEKNYANWRKKGWWLEGHLWFGFDVTHARVVGTEPLLIWMAEDPELVRDIFKTELDASLQILNMIWERGYKFDSIAWCDDMGYRNGTFFSVAMYRELLQPFQRRAIEWAHARGIVARLHSCGNINAFVPDLVAMGLDALNPLEVKAGMDPVALKQAYGDRLVLHGGLNAMLWDQMDKVEVEIRRLLPILKRNGGYIFQEDHSIPDCVRLKDYQRIVALAKELGRY